MKRILFMFFIVASVVLTSCVPHKNTLYIQDRGTNVDSLGTIVEKQKNYRVQINDILNIRVKALDQDNVQIFNPVGEGKLNATGEEKAYFDGFTIDVHGNIRIPSLGKLNVLGYTTAEIEKMIEDKLLAEEFKETANIFVTVKLTGLKYTTIGEIGSPGTNILYQERVNILDAIANSGDIPVTGNKRDILIIRQYPQGQKIHHIDITDIEAMNSPYYYIQPNDMIYIKPLKQKSWGIGTTTMQTVGVIMTAFSVLTTTLLLIDRL